VSKTKPTTIVKDRQRNKVCIPSVPLLNKLSLNVKTRYNKDDVIIQ
jgi:hypothetical protein